MELRGRQRTGDPGPRTHPRVREREGLPHSHPLPSLPPRPPASRGAADPAAVKRCARRGIQAPRPCDPPSLRPRARRGHGDTTHHMEHSEGGIGATPARGSSQNLSQQVLQAVIVIGRLGRRATRSQHREGEKECLFQKTRDAGPERTRAVCAAVYMSLCMSVYTRLQHERDAGLPGGQTRPRQLEAQLLEQNVRARGSSGSSCPDAAP